MQHKTSFWGLILAGILILIVTGVALSMAQPAKAQCGSQASSCKNCHEVQGQDAVNKDGTNWHQAHAFGDFCYLCHGGNSQATDKVGAHAGMVPPLSDVKAACSSCHAQDYMALAGGYATTLGVQIGSGSSSGSATAAATQAAAPAAGSTTATPLAVQPPSSGAGPVVVENQPVIDYSAQYNSSELGRTPINWGNVILGLIIAVVVIAGVTFVSLNERKLKAARAPMKDTPSDKTAPVQLEDYSEEVKALLPRIKALNPVGRKALMKLLADPDAASELLLSLSRLDPDLIRRMKGLDREAQALLIALAND